MKKYPLLKNFICYHRPFERDPDRQNIGKHFLHTLYYKVAHLQHINISQNPLTIEELIEVAYKELNIPNDFPFLTTIAKISIDGRWIDQKMIIPDMTLLIKQALTQTHQTKMVQQSLLSLKNDSSQQKEHETNSSATQNSQQKEIPVQKEQKTALQSVEPSNVAAYAHEVEAYLKQINRPQMELDLICQQLDIPFPHYCYDEEGKVCQVRGLLTLNNCFTGYKLVQFKCQETSVSRNNAYRKAAYSLIGKMFGEYPRLWRAFMNIRKIRKLKKY